MPDFVKPAALPLPAMLAVISAAIVTAGLIAGCARDPGARELDEERLETVEVDAGVTARLTPEGDAVAAPRAPEIAGALPPDYPSDLPVPLPSSVVDFGPAGGADRVDAGVVAGDGAQRFVLVSSSLPAAEVEAQLLRALRASGWRAVPGAGPWRREQAGQLARYRVEDAGRDGTRVRIEYPARRASGRAQPD